MGNQTNVENVNGVSPAQELLKEKANKLLDILNAEPKARLVPFLHMGQSGIYPDVQLKLVKEDVEDTNKGNGTEDTETNSNSEEESAE